MNDFDLTDTEREFFAQGETEESVELDTFADLDVGFERPSLWQRLFGKRDEH